MYTIDDIGELLDEAASEIPPDFYTELNGGVNLLPETKHHAADVSGELYVLGEYCHDHMGRYIVIYYGSLCNVYPNIGSGTMKARLKKLLLHEFTHHLESLAGEHGLEDKDRCDLARYVRGKLRPTSSV
ncbi:MAG: metallopeptidase family protein [Oscillospiraceae bacterium]|nr:metallopeptidase family protein [Oscillospiraceae bacterium]